MEKMTNRNGGYCPPQSLKRSAKLSTTKNFIIFLVRNAKEKSRWHLKVTSLELVLVEKAQK
jgi:hypothetical protein